METATKSQLVPGTSIEMAGREWVVPPLTVSQYLRLLPTIKAAQNVEDMQAIPTIVETVTTALQRNYPDLTMDAVADMLDLGNMLRAFVAALSRNPAANTAPLITAAAANSIH